MAKYDKIFNSKKTAEESLNPKEAVAAIAIVTAAADSSLEDVDIDLLTDVLWGFDIFEEYSDDDLLEMLDKLVVMAEEKTVGVLFNAAREALSDELLLDAFAAGVSVLVDEEELQIPKGKMALLKKLQEALEIDEEEAKEVIEEVITAFEEAEEEYDEDDGEGEGSLGEDDSLAVYESPLKNFTLPTPVYTEEGGRVQSQEGLVSFSDDLGTMLRIDYYRIRTEQEEEMSSVGQEQYLKSLLLDKYVPEAIAPDLPKTAVNYTEYLADAMDGAYFALVNMPEGSTISKIANNGTATKLNAYRGLMAFSEGEFFYIVSSQHSFPKGKTPGSTKLEAEDIKQKILEFVETIEFT
ncbi:MAG: hypothetical protein PUP93_32945 [Rhizonema sp. NSF051]|nr:hypothetical protein [Rhizonema sp. NSF051]